MNVAAGVLLIFISLFNFVAALGYLAGGGIASIAGHTGENIVETLENEESAKNELSDPKEKQEIEKNIKDVKAAGVAFLGFGAFLLILAALEIGAGVVLFKKKAKIFIIVIGILEIIAEVGGSLISPIEFGFTNIFGIAVGILAIIAAFMLRSKPLKIV